MSYRLALGPCRCRHRLFPPRNPVVQQACAELEKRLRHYEALGFEALDSAPRDYTEVVQLESGFANFFTYKVDLSLTETLLVLTATVPTLWFPTYLSFHGIGHLVAEGLIYSSNGTVKEAPNDVMWTHR
jgi:hypothetical protein